VRKHGREDRSRNEILECRNIKKVKENECVLNKCMKERQKEERGKRRRGRMTEKRQNERVRKRKRAAVGAL